MSGIVRHNDCKTPYKKAKVEFWHCDNDGVYDNSTNEFRHRGTVYSDDKGQYSFKTILPPPYDAGGFMRPAHFHMMITADGYQSLVTQLYFYGDKHIEKDTWASSEKAKKRILQVDTAKDGSKNVAFDVNLNKKLAVEPSSIGKLTGIYTDEKNPNKKIEFFTNKNTLWIKNDVYGMDLEYIENNKFQPRGTPESGFTYFFEIQPSGAVKLTYAFRNNGTFDYSVAMKDHLNNK